MKVVFVFVSFQLQASQLFRALGVEVRVLKADEAFPDCVFVEDPAIVIEGHALITKPGDPSRQDEIRRIRRTLRDELQLPFLEGIDEEDTTNILFGNPDDVNR